MKTPWYETSPGATAALLLTKLFVDADLYTFTLPGGGVLRYSAGPVSVSVNGTLWSGFGALFDQDGSRATGHWTVGLDSEQWTVVVMPRPVDLITQAANPDTIGSLPFAVALRTGALDGAVCQVDRAFSAAWPSVGQALAPTGVVTMFAGRVGEVDVGRSASVIVINSFSTVMSQSLPRNLYQSGCIHTLFDQGCTLTASSYAVAGVIAGAAAARVNPISAAVSAPAGSGTFALGRLVMTSGANAGFARSIRSWVPGSPASITLLKPFYFPLSIGDAFTAYPGCDKQFATCAAFGNQPNFGGEIAIPVPEAAV